MIQQAAIPEAGRAANGAGGYPVNISTMLSVNL